MKRWVILFIAICLLIPTGSSIGDMGMGMGHDGGVVSAGGGAGDELLLEAADSLLIETGDYLFLE